MGRSEGRFLLWLLCILHVLSPIYGYRGSDTSPSPRISTPFTRGKDRAYGPAYPRKSHSRYAPSPVTSPNVGRTLHTPASAPPYLSPPPSYHQVLSYPPVALQKNRHRLHKHHAPLPYVKGPSTLHMHAPVPSTNSAEAAAPSPTTVISSIHWPIHSPVSSPFGSFERKPRTAWPQTVHALPPPPPNLDCSTIICRDPLTNPPAGSPCDCVLPMKVELRVNVALYMFFPVVSELAQEIASGVSMELSQVRIIGANAADGDPEKTTVLINLVPRGKFFDKTSALLTYEKFWYKQISIKASYFGDYDVHYVWYPGLPPSPPREPARAFGGDGNPMIIHPFAADVEKPKEKHHRSIKAIIILSAVIASVVCIAVVLSLFVQHRYSTRMDATIPQLSQPPSVKPSGTGFTVYRNRPSSGLAFLSSSIATHIGQSKTFGLFEIERATNKFDDSRIIGEGGFGRVYQGTLDDGMQVAVKVLKREDLQGEREFLAEVEILGRLHHRNLVKLIGICVEAYIRCLVYELIPNGSVESHLYGVDKETASLDWNARLKIALGAARCLAYLHEDSSPHVIHRDFKSSNILLEHDFTPKVCDFGLARTTLCQGNEHISTRVMGTFGYVAPEYAMTGHLLVKSDVYSYGVVLLELLTGRKPVDMLRPPGQENLVTWARPLLTSKEGLEALVDPSLGSNFPFDSLSKVAAIASMCVQPEVSQRPFMGEVVQALKLVCNEINGQREFSSFSQGELSALHKEIKTDRGSGLEIDSRLSTSDIFSISARFTRDESDSFRLYSSSGPLRTGRSRQFWQWLKGLSGGSMSEHGVGLRHVGKFEGDEWL